MTLKLASLELPDGRPSETSEVTVPASEARAHRKSGFLPRRLKTPKTTPRPTGSRSDWMIMLGGVGLAAICAMFPWYIFFNQEQFGVRPMSFAGRPTPEGPTAEALPDLIGRRIPTQIIAMPQIDYTPTGTVAQSTTEAIEDQPFPGDEAGFRLVHVIGGRAMIEDDDGYWMVRRGSRLPDGSRVSHIRRSGDTWEIVTSRELVIRIASGMDGT